uniref:Uncharacterized protein n=1 Tax=Onchocerca volvulus TaxID=6282 RepID=A0A8R1TM70_ONCVO
FFFWHVVKHIPIDHKISIRYFPDVKSIITVRLTDRNGIVALTVTIDYKTGILFTKRDRFVDENVPYVNFGSSKQFSAQMLGRIEIDISAHRYKVLILICNNLSNVTNTGNFVSDDIGKCVGMRLNFDDKITECLIFGHHYSPYDIEQTIFDSTNKNMIAYVHHLQLD